MRRLIVDSKVDTDLERDLKMSSESASKLSKERDEPVAKIASVAKEVQGSQGVVTALRSEISQIRAELTTATHQQENSLSELKSAARREEDAESIQCDLQEEAAG